MRNFIKADTEYNGNLKDSNTCLSSCYFPITDKVLLTPYNNTIIAKVKTPFLVGIWKIKKLK